MVSIALSLALCPSSVFCHDHIDAPVSTWHASKTHQIDPANLIYAALTQHQLLSALQKPPKVCCLNLGVLRLKLPDTCSKDDRGASLARFPVCTSQPSETVKDELNAIPGKWTSESVVRSRVVKRCPCPEAPLDQTSAYCCEKLTKVTQTTYFARSCLAYVGTSRLTGHISAKHLSSSEW
ncbi:hypothetical protein VFPPC_17839 [Pochonia chlamydosporia 170]|uniref:Uncharacterized protein n=1 Tax=Pochonia chlamydosporia 170 TaxID=1380566 RepID=A0A219AQA3_METCM|nr:hypothetical protein VFPPC_17839 [Pochonia chlamydosporia 170]OWT42968.1 hypothetical protein VFPPC_17839 [Pochonia chlamydosporia 170]